MGQRYGRFTRDTSPTPSAAFHAGPAGERSGEWMA
jgi:hypothetical protein